MRWHENKTQKRFDFLVLAVMFYIRKGGQTLREATEPARITFIYAQPHHPHTGEPVAFMRNNGRRKTKVNTIRKIFFENKNPASDGGAFGAIGSEASPFNC